MAAYYVGTICVTNVEIWNRYVDEVGATISAHGGEIMLRGQRVGGDVTHLSSGSLLVVVLRFVDDDAARRWHDSVDYQRLVPIRDAGADVELVRYIGMT